MNIKIGIKEVIAALVGLSLLSSMILLPTASAVEILLVVAPSTVVQGGILECDTTIKIGAGEDIPETSQIKLAIDGNDIPVAIGWSGLQSSQNAIKKFQLTAFTANSITYTITPYSYAVSLALNPYSYSNAYGYAINGVYGYAFMPYSFIPGYGYGYASGFTGPSEFKYDCEIDTSMLSPQLSQGPHTLTAKLHIPGASPTDTFVVSQSFTVGQSNSATVSNPVAGGSNIILSVSNGNFTSVGPQPVPSSITTSLLSSLLNANVTAVNFPHGMIKFTATTTPNDTITVTITYPSLPPLGSNQSYLYVKVNPNDDDDVRIVSQGTGPDTFSISGNTVTLRIKDNGQFDFDPNLGVISDPGGIAIVTTTPPAPPAGGGGGGGGGGTIVISQQRSTIATLLAVQPLPSSIEIGRSLTITGSLTDDKGSRLALNGTVSIVAQAGNNTSIYTAELRQGEFSTVIKASDLLKSLKSRDVTITVRFDGFEVQETRQRIIEYKGSEVKHSIRITGEDIVKNIKAFKRPGVSLLLLDNFTEKGIAKILLKVDGQDAKILFAKGKDMDRKRLSMQEVELTVKDGKLVGFGDTARLLVYARGTVAYTAYDVQGNVIAEGRF
ncbi:MAG: choice-of-anchor U domain-containing protein [Candidatus Nitrosocaldus sp.]|nr:hypothetical protein [Candidatus Nitrosocaldus sp.]MDW8276344.1 choice-of-anchor U domain-containing protein [Candidatus Nitrosocaldus sp.]